MMGAGFPSIGQTSFTWSTSSMTMIDAVVVYGNDAVVVVHDNADDDEPHPQAVLVAADFSGRQ